MNLSMDPEEWLEMMFEFEDCDECGKGAMYHTAVPFIGNWFASCNEPVIETLSEPQEVRRSWALVTTRTQAQTTGKVET